MRVTAAPATRSAGTLVVLARIGAVAPVHSGSMSDSSPLPPSVLSSFVPEDRRRALAAGTPLPDPSEGAVLFADLSGFTALTAALANAFGPRRGAEELTRHLTATYDALVREVHARMGSVVGFSGDAITCWFEGDDGTRAIGAAHAMQAAMAGLPPVNAGAERLDALGLKVAVVRGPVRRFAVGDPAIQRIDVLAGATLDRLARCEGLARAGEVVVDASLVQIAHGRPPNRRTDPSDGFEVTVLTAPDDVRPGSGGWATRGSEDGSWHDAWVLPAVRDRLRHGIDGQAADFRPATALFLSFSGIDYDLDGEAGDKLDAFIRWVQGVVTSWGGAVVQLTLGDKGAYAYACFGAPVAHDDDAARAVAAAQTLRQPPQAYVENVRIGLAHGQMYTGTYGARSRRTFGVLGPKTNLAARLMVLAPPGGVLCDEGVVAQARRAWRFEERPPRRVKGFDAPVAVFVPGARITADPRHARTLVGRRDEEEMLRRALASADQGTATTVTIEGDAGQGKSHMVAWLSQETTSRGGAVVQARGSTLAERTPYAIWRQVTRELIAAAEWDASDVETRLASIAPDLAPWAPLLLEIAGFASRPNGQAIDVAPDVRRRYLARLLAALLRAAGVEGAVVLALDDAHRMDSVSWELLADLSEELAAAPARVMTVVACRGQELTEQAVHVLNGLKVAGARTLALPGLGSEAVGVLVARILEVPSGAVPETLVERVTVQAAGNPHYAEEMVVALVEDGFVRVDGVGVAARVRLTSTSGRDEAGLPRTLHGLVLARIDRAPAEQGTVLKIAAAVGVQFQPAPLRAVLPHGVNVLEGALRERLDGLAAHDLIVHEAENRYAFRHALVHEVAYESMLYAQRRQVHTALAAWYEAATALTEDERLPTLAHHHARSAEGSGDAARIDRAVGYLSEVAGQYERSGAVAEAAGALRQAIALTSELDGLGPRRDELLTALGATLEKSGALHEARTTFEDVLSRTVPARLRAEALAGLCLVHTRAGRHEDARSTGRQALTEAERYEDGSLGALVRGRLGILAALDGALEEAEAYFDEAQRYYSERSQPRNAASWLNNLGLARILQGRYDHARRPLTEALTLAREVRAQDIEAQVLTNLGLAAQREENLEEAAGHYRDSLSLARALRARHDVVTLVVNLGDLALARGDLREAWSAYREAAQDASLLGATPKLLDALRGAAEVLHARGQREPAASVLGFVLAHPDRNVEVMVEADRVREILRDSVDEEVLAPALAKGEASTLDDVLRRIDGYGAAD